MTRDPIEAAYAAARQTWKGLDWHEDAIGLSPKAVELDAMDAEEAAENAIFAYRDGDLETAILIAEEAARIERTYGDDPTWGEFAELLRKQGADDDKT